MNLSVLSGSVAAAVLASSASAAVFTGWTASSTTNSAGNAVWSVYANFDVAGLVFLNCFNHGGAAGGANQTSGSMGAMHNDLYSDPAGGVFGSWSPSATNSGLNSGDSYVTATGNFGGAATGTALDPSFSDTIGDHIDQAAGWYDASPGTANVMGASFKVMQIVRGAGDANFSAYLRIGFKVAGTTTALFGQGTYTLTPAPGALALIGLAGVVSRRRR